MPELPDVEASRRRLADHATGREVTAVRVGDRDLLEGTTPAGLGRSLRGRTLGAPQRHGKWLILTTTADPGPTVLIHLRMTGEMVVGQDAHGGDMAVALHLDDGGAVGYRSRRRLGAVHYLRPGVETATVTGPLGPDALGIERAKLAQRLTGRRGGLKSALLDQRVVAGLGNELVDEILWRAGISPAQPVATVTHEQLRGLHRELGIVLRSSVRAGRVPTGPTWLTSQRTVVSPTCPRCGTALRPERVAGRATLWCPAEQGASG